MNTNNTILNGDKINNANNDVNKKATAKAVRQGPFFGVISSAILGVICVLVLCWYLAPNVPFEMDGLTKDDVTVSSEHPTAEDVESMRQKNARALEEEEKLKREEEKYKREIQRRTVLFQSNVEAAYERFLKQVPFVDAQSAVEAARVGAKFLASGDGLCGFTTMFKMAYKLTYDKIKETQTFEEFVNPLFEQHVMTHILTASDVYKTKMAAFQREVECEALAYQADVALRGEAFRGFMSKLTLVSPEMLKKADERTTTFESQVMQMANSSVKVTAATVVEVAYIKTTIQAAKTLGKRVIAPYFAKIVARFCASQAFGAGAAVADGPLPIGEIAWATATVGCGLWTAYEIYKLMDIIPTEIETNLLACINEVDAELRKQTSAQAKKLVTEIKTWSEEQTKGL